MSERKGIRQMAIDAKMSFLSKTEKKLSVSVTAETMTKVLAIIADVMEGYDMRETAFFEDQQDDLLDCYIDALRVQGRSEKTLTRYRYIIQRMMEDIKVPTRTVTVYHLRQYIARQKERGIADSTMEGIRQVFTAYFNWLQRESLIDRNPTANLGAIKCAKRKKQILTEVDMHKLNENCKNDRDRAIVAFLSSTGCRVSEVVELNRDKIRLNGFDGAECIVHGKGNKERRVYLDNVSAMLLRRYLNSRQDDNPALFIGKRNERLQPGGIRCMLNTLAKTAGVDHVHPHKFRRTLATDLSRHGMPIQEVSHLLGHEKIDTTMGYVIQDDDNVRNDYKRYA